MSILNQNHKWDRRDDLLEKFSLSSLRKEEAEELAPLMEDILSDPKSSQNEKLSASMVVRWLHVDYDTPIQKRNGLHEKVRDYNA